MGDGVGIVETEGSDVTFCTVVASATVFIAFVVLVFKTGRRGLFDGGLTVVAPLPVVFRGWSTVCSGRFGYGTFFFRSGLPNGYLNIVLFGFELGTVKFGPRNGQSACEAESHTQNPKTPGMVN